MRRRPPPDDGLAIKLRNCQQRYAGTFQRQSTHAPVRVEIACGGPRRASLLGVGQVPPRRPAAGSCVVQVPHPTFLFAQSGRDGARATPQSSRSSLSRPRPPPTHPAAAPWRCGSPRPPAPGALRSSPRRCYRSWAGGPASRVFLPGGVPPATRRPPPSLRH
ncbi:hypothetical protein MRX96_015963 [Rhipicephalus microplus]